MKKKLQQKKSRRAGKWNGQERGKKSVECERGMPSKRRGNMKAEKMKIRKKQTEEKKS